MNAPSSSRGHSVGWLLAGAAALIATAAAVLFWLLPPAPYSTGHRWQVYPLATGSADDDSSTEQEQQTFAGNVKVISVLYEEHFLTGEPPYQQPQCHVVVDLPPGWVLRVRGGGSDNGAMLRRVSLKPPASSENPDSDCELELLYNPQKGQLSMRGRTFQPSPGQQPNPIINDEWSQGPAEVRQGNVFVVRQSDEAGIAQIAHLNDIIKRPFSPADVEQALKKADVLRGVTKNN